MAINWSLLNPNLPAEVKTVDAFGALQAGQNQALARQDQQQTSALRDLQLQTGTQALADKSAADQAERLMALSFEAHQKGDVASAESYARQAAATDLRTTQTIAAQHQQVQAQGEKDARENAKYNQEQAQRAAPLVVANRPKIEQFFQANPNATPEEAGAFLKDTLGEFFDPRQVPAFVDPAKRQMGLDHFQQIWDNSPEKLKRDEEARRQAHNDFVERRLLARDQSGAGGGHYGDLKAAAHVLSDPNASPEDKLAAQAMLGGKAPPDLSTPPAAEGNVHGEAFLKTLTRDEQAHVKALVEGREPFPTGRAATDPRWQRLLSLANQYDPGYDQINAPARVATRKEFFGGGRSNKNIAALNNVMGHLTQLADAADELDNGPLTPINAARNAYRARVSDPALRKFRVAQSAVADELENVFTGTGGTLHGRTHWLSQFDEDVSSSTLRETIASTLGLLDSRLNALADRYRKGMGVTKDPIDFLTPQAKEKYLKLKAAIAPAAGAAGGDALPADIQDILNRHGVQHGNP